MDNGYGGNLAFKMSFIFQNYLARERRHNQILELYTFERFEEMLWG